MKFNYSHYKVAWWLQNPHGQTIIASLFGKKNHLILKHERINLPDGDFIDLHHYGNINSKKIIILLHGLEGTIKSHYVQSIFPILARNDYHCIFMYLRNSGPERNRLAKTYHAADTYALEHTLKILHNQYPHKKLFALGYSLGSAILLNYLAQPAASNLLQAAIAVSVPFDLELTAQTMETGFGRIYQRRFMKSINKKIKPKKKQFEQAIQKPILTNYNTLYHYDNDITAPLHGFANAKDYYTKASCKQNLKKISTSTLIIQAKDDPFMTHSAIPTPEELSSSISLITTEHGGHVGFISGESIFKANFWLNTIIPEYLTWIQEQQT